MWDNFTSCMYENDNMENAEESLYIAISNGDLDKALQFIANGLFYLTNWLYISLLIFALT